MGGAKVGDKTIIDALEPAFNRAAKSGTRSIHGIFQIAASAAGEVASSTAHKISRIGRASHLGERIRGTIDPGAMFIHLFLHAMSQGL